MTASGNNKCSVAGCKKSASTFHFFPYKDQEALNIWLSRIGDDTLSALPLDKIKNRRICSAHFSKHCIIPQCDKKQLLRKRSLPTIGLRNFNEAPSVENSILLSRKICKAECTDTESEDSSTWASTSNSYRLSSFKSSRVKADEVLEKIAERIDHPVAKKPTLRYDAFGQHIAEKLRSLPPLMVAYCQKLINDAIFNAETNNLNITSRIVTDPKTLSIPVVENEIVIDTTTDLN